MPRMLIRNRKNKSLLTSFKIIISNFSRHVRSKETMHAWKAVIIWNINNKSLFTHDIIKFIKLYIKCCKTESMMETIVKEGRDRSRSQCYHLLGRGRGVQANAISLFLILINPVQRYSLLLHRVKLSKYLKKQFSLKKIHNLMNRFLLKYFKIMNRFLLKYFKIICYFMMFSK